MFNFIKQKLHKVFSHISAKLSGFWQKKTIDEQTLKELELILLQADTGVETTRTIIANLKEKVLNGTIADGSDLRTALAAQLTQILKQCSYQAQDAQVFVLVGVNGCGKTTLASKLAHQAVAQGKKPLLVAADTFRAAATEQLATWAERTGCALVQGTAGQDPASVVFSGAQQFAQGDYDVLIIDTAGRLQTKSHLMAELTKLKRMVTRHLPDAKIATLLTVDAMLGQNSFEQAKLFHESTDLTGVVLTKMDGTGKGGIIFSITQSLDVPVAYISFGEKVEDLKRFDAQAYVHELLG